MCAENGDRKLCIICSKGSLDMAYPGLVLANAALMEGIDVIMFFTFWGLDIVNKKKMEHLKVTPIGNPSMGIPNSVAGLPGMTNLATVMMRREIEKLDFPLVEEFLQMIADAGGKLYGCKMSMDMMHLTRDDLFAEVEAVVGATDFMEMSEGAQIIFV
ncbi:MAG: DsrE/DsrF/DrsH-like family protein [Chloroflexi bacterium]|nr:DsrE/DsrF/DrsH-like family protein [Chloroflexota bacterium]MCI0646098.1 DsrE/DsrF/DrsH-like family protein [Chloroflexota bacterium]MCI0731576.1 DsrE/DsrF/DrsH-like family protein [Chloroflexota bacterium]